MGILRISANRRATRSGEPLIFEQSHTTKKGEGKSLPPSSWWRYGDSNPRPIRCERIALPTVLYPRMLVGTTGLEPVTSCMSSKRSNQLSYAPSSAYVLYQLFFIMASIFTLFILKAPKNSAPFLIINNRRRSRSIRRNRRRSRNRPRRNPPNTRRNRSRRHSPRSRSRNPRRSCPQERMQAFPPC